MKWHEVREKFPDQWVLLEALDARSEGGRWLVGDMSVVATCGDNGSAMWDCYKSYHEAYPQREIFFFHTGRTELDIQELHSRFLVPMDAWQASE